MKSNNKKMGNPKNGSLPILFIILFLGIAYLAVAMFAPGLFNQASKGISDFLEPIQKEASTLSSSVGDFITPEQTPTPTPPPTPTPTIPPTPAGDPDLSIDLREIALPYLGATDVKALCESFPFTTWHWESDFVGCEGAGASDCTTALHLSAQVQCEAVNATWICNSTNIYCYYS